MTISQNIIIGSSPISLVKAILMGRSNKEILIIDKGKSIGGCWQISQHSGMNFDLGCHFLVPFEADVDNIKLISAFKNLGISAELTNPKAYFDRKIDEIKDYSRDYKYIKVDGGYPNIIKTLHDCVLDLGIPILKDNILSISVDNEVSLIGERKDYKTENLFIPSYCDLRKIEVHGKNIDLECPYQDSQHLVILAKGLWNKKHYDYYFLNESDKFTFDKLTVHEGHEKHLFNIRVGKKHKLKSDKELIKLASDFIKELGYEIKKIIYSERHIYEFPYRSELYVRNFQKNLDHESGGKIKMFYTRNFTKALLEANV